MRCSRAEKRCPACWAMLQESTVLSAVLDRTMFRFHRSTTWLDQAQRKAPRRLVRVKSGSSVRERTGALRGSSAERRKPARPAQRQECRGGVPQQRAQRRGAHCPLAPPMADTQEEGSPLDTPNLEPPGRHTLPRGTKTASLCDHVTGLS